MVTRAALVLCRDSDRRLCRAGQSGVESRIYGTTIRISDCNARSYGGVLWIRNQGYDEVRFPMTSVCCTVRRAARRPLMGRCGEVVPVIDFGFFYVTGYSGDPCDGVDPNDDPVTNGATVVGHFIKFFPIDLTHD